MASRGHLGGLAWTTPQALRVLDAAGCDVVLVETVGVGQSEVEVAGAGRHHARAARARAWATASRPPRPGILEIGDVYVVNKADRDGADQVRRELRSMLALGRAARGRLAAADRARRSPRRARASTRSSRRSTGTAPGWTSPASWRARRTPAGPRRDRGDRAHRAARALGRRARAGVASSTSWPPVAARELDPYARGRRAARRRGPDAGRTRTRRAPRRACAVGSGRTLLANVRRPVLQTRMETAIERQEAGARRASIVFVGFWMFTDPNGLAEAAQAGGASLGPDRQLFQAVISLHRRARLTRERARCGTDARGSPSPTSASTCCATRARSSSTRSTSTGSAYAAPGARGLAGAGPAGLSSRSSSVDLAWVPFLVGAARCCCTRAGWRWRAQWTGS